MFDIKMCCSIVGWWHKQLLKLCQQNFYTFLCKKYFSASFFQNQEFFWVNGRASFVNYNQLIEYKITFYLEASGG